MSECRSLTNITGNAVAAVVISAWEKALDRDRMKAVLGGKPVEPLEDVPLAR
jgi:aerobic C4-dicarboxylate transport protein